MEEKIDQQTSAGQGMGIAALILGIVSLIIAFIPCFGWVAAIPGAVGIVLGILGYNEAKKANGAKGLTLAGMIISIIATLIALAWFIFFAGAAHQGKKALDSISNELKEELKDAENNVEDAVQEVETDTPDKAAEELQQMDNSSDEMTDEQKAEKLEDAAKDALKDLQDALDD